MIRPDTMAGRDPLEPAGFPSPAADYAETGISLDASLITHREATFFFRARGHGLVAYGIHDGDLLIVDRALAPTPGRMVVATAGGEFVVRQYLAGVGGPRLRGAPGEREIDLAGEEVQLWGVVCWAVHRL